MKFHWACAGWLLASLCLLQGCATTSRDGHNHPRTFALAVAITSGTQPTAAQWTALNTAFASVVRARGQLIADVNVADEVILVRFDPDPNTPDGGRATVVAVDDRDPSRIPRSRPGIIDPESNPWRFTLVMDALNTR